MDQKVEELINNCIDLQHEIGLLAPIILFLSPSSNIEKTMEANMPKPGRFTVRKKLEQLNSPDKIKTEYTLRIKEFESKLADVAELLEEEEFEIDKFRSRLSEGQLDWLTSHKKEIKKHLKGIELK
jgi:hypothetical protein